MEKDTKTICRNVSNMMNINMYSLFGTEDALIDTVAKKELLLRE
jgi:hypothetical protein